MFETGQYRKVERPSYEQLQNELRTTSMVQVGKKYGVSDNTIRKWLKKYEKYSNKNTDIADEVNISNEQTNTIEPNEIQELSQLISTMGEINGENNV